MNVTLSEVRKQYGSVRALDGVDFTLQTGITGLLGPNGAGKTTLLRCLATVLAPDDGKINVLGFDPDHPNERTEIRRRIGYLPQEPGFYRNFTCFDFIDYLAILKEHVDRVARHAEVRRVLELTGLSDKSTTKIRKLSGGMRRRLALAQSLLGTPGFLILDEPTAGLDPELRFRFRQLVTELAADRIVLLSTHQTEDVAAICDRVIVLDAGKVRFDGAPAALIEVAAGKVWMSDERPTSARITWRTATGEHRAVGEPPEGARLIEPTIEDGYLMLVGVAALVDETEAA
ncbi:MAG TPA: ABC transporter ATP-binding protein [Acidimicrobiia bacterium]|nr:ABC transporter ATP-binding protein [Acidimicrobiia bacterium]